MKLFNNSPVFTSASVAADIGEFYIEAVLDHIPKGFKRPPRAELRFFIQWLGYDASENSWEPWKNVRTNSVVHAYCRANNMTSIVSEEKAGAWSGGEEDPRIPDDGASSLAVVLPSDPPVSAGLHTSFALSFTASCLLRCQEFCQGGGGGAVDLPSSILYLFVVNWAGEEKARMQVRPSDTVLVGMRQVEEQLGVAPCRQRLVVGERQLGEEDVWSVCGVLDWSTVQLTIIVEVSCDELPSSCVVMKTTQQDIPNAFAPLELDPVHKSPSTTIDAAHPLFLHSRSLVLGMRGIELRAGSGLKGFFEIRCIRGMPGDISIGLATHYEELTDRRIGNGYEGIGWKSRRLLMNDTISGINSFGGRFHRLSPGFTTGDVLGLMMDCRGAPTLLLFVNGTNVLEIVLRPQVWDRVLFPVFRLIGDSEIEIFQNPDLPEPR